MFVYAQALDNSGAIEAWQALDSGAFEDVSASADKLSYIVQRLDQLDEKRSSRHFAQGALSLRVSLKGVVFVDVLALDVDDYGRQSRVIVLGGLCKSERAKLSLALRSLPSVSGRAFSDNVKQALSNIAAQIDAGLLLFLYFYFWGFRK